MKRLRLIVVLMIVCAGARYAYAAQAQAQAAANITYSASDFYKLIWRTEKIIGESRNQVLTRAVTLRKLQNTTRRLSGSKRMLYIDAASSIKNQTYAPYGAFCLSTDGSLLAE